MEEKEAGQRPGAAVPCATAASAPAPRRQSHYWEIRLSSNAAMRNISKVKFIFPTSILYPDQEKIE